MAEIITMPKMSDTMEEGVIASWQKKVGDEVKSGDILAEVETDKATMELESYSDGFLLHIGVEEKSAVAVDGMIAIIGEKDENIDELISNADSAPKKPLPEVEKEDAPAPKAVDTSDVNASVITMPKMSDTMTEGTIASWQMKVGDEVKSGDIIAEVETDKATMELEAYDEGTLLYVAVEAGNSVAVDDVIAIVGEEGADYQKLLDAQSQAAAAPSEEKPKEDKKEEKGNEAPKASASKPASAPAASSSSNNGRVKISPLAKKLANELGYDVTMIEGSGDQGRIIKRDIESFDPSLAKAAGTSAASGGAAMPQVVGQESFTEEKVSQMRKVIAKRLSESKFTSPHFYLTMEIDMDKAIAARKSMNKMEDVKVSFNDLVIKAVAMSLRRHPAVNSSWLGDTIRYNNHIHIGVAVAVDEGLLVPVVRFADSKSLSMISGEVKELGAKAKNKELQPSEWEGNTFTISNLGMFGIEEFTAIVNPPDACILAVGGIKAVPVVKDGQVVAGNTMKVTLSCDHRVVDGAVGAAFLKTLKEFLEDPIRLLV